MKATEPFMRPPEPPMSFAKAQDLLRLAEMAAARHSGISLAEIAETFGVDHRTAQRMTRALENMFPAVETLSDPERRKRWKIRGNDLRLLHAQGLRDGELAALDMGIRRAERDGAANEVRALTDLRERLLATMPGTHARRTESDAGALLEAWGYASRPGPRVRSDPIILGTIAEALKAPFPLAILYVREGEAEARERVVEPHGLLFGVRQYLVARDPADPGRMRHFRLDRIARARIEPGSFARDPEFDLAAHAARAFGSWFAPQEFGEVVWRFAPRAAPVARDFVFHPGQTMIEEEDGSLTVRFEASGWLEMAWHLYQWGDTVEVLAPEGLRAMVEGWRRGDFPALP